VPLPLTVAAGSPATAPSQVIWIRAFGVRFRPLTAIDIPGAPDEGSVAIAGVAAVLVVSGIVRVANTRTMASVASLSRQPSAGGPVVSDTQRVPFQKDMGGDAPFGDPADCMSPVALRPRLATGVPVRGWVVQHPMATLPTAAPILNGEEGVERTRSRGTPHALQPHEYE
jgi:hypothetical protein